MVNTILLLILSSPFLTIQYKSYSYVEALDISDSDETSRCVSYDAREKEIKLTCKLAHLSDIYNQLTDRTILNKEGQLNDSNNSNVWLLNAGITVEKGSTLIIDPKDTKWLKIFDDRKIANPIIVHGSLLIDSVKVTSWDQNTNDYVKFDPEILQDKEHEHTGIDAVPRPYIMIDKGATGLPISLILKLHIWDMNVVVAVPALAIMAIPTEIQIRSPKHNQKQRDS